MASPVNKPSELVKPARKRPRRPRVVGIPDSGFGWPLVAKSPEFPIASLLEIRPESFSIDCSPDTVSRRRGVLLDLGAGFENVVYVALGADQHLM